MLATFVSLLCSLFTISSLLVYSVDGSGIDLLAYDLKQFERRQDDEHSSSTTVDLKEMVLTPVVYVAATTSTTSLLATITSIYTTTSWSITVTTTVTNAVSSGNPSASDCATLAEELNGEPYTAPMGHQYELQCLAFYYSDDSNIVATHYNVASYRACANLCDGNNACNLFFLARAAAGDQAQECFLLSSDIYGMESNSILADAGRKVGYVSQDT